MARRKRRRRRALLWIALVLLVGLSVNVYLALRPQVVEARVRGALEQAFACPFEFDSVAINLRGYAEVENFRLLAESGNGKILEAGLVRVFPRLIALLGGRFEVELLVIEDLELKVFREGTGRWNVEGLLRARQGGGQLRLPDTVIKRCRIDYTDASTFSRPVAYEIRNLRLALMSEDDGAISFESEVRDGPVRKLLVSGRCEFPFRPLRLNLRFRAFKVDISSRFDHFLPPALAEKLRTLNLQGYLDNVSGDLRFDEREGLKAGNIGGLLVRCRLAPSQLPFPLKGLSGPFHIRDRTVHLGLKQDGNVEYVRGDFGGGRLELQASLELEQESFRLKGWSGLVKVDSLPVDRRLDGLLPPELQNLLDRFQPQGEVGLRLEVPSSRHLPPRSEEVSAVLNVQGVDVEYQHFPYRVENVTGRVVLSEGLIRFDGLQGKCGSGVVTVVGGVIDPKPGGAISVALRAQDEPGIKLDERFRSALPAGLKDLWDDFQPAGRVSGMVRIERDALEPGSGEGALEPGDARIIINAFPRDARIAYESFPYQVHNITGAIVYDSFNEQVELKLLRGFHGNQLISAEGVVLVGEEPEFSVKLNCDSLTVDRALSNAFSAEGRKILEDFGFKGRVKTAVGIFMTPGGPVEVITDVDVLEGSMRHVKFPYPLTLEAGHLKLIGTKFFVFSDFQGYREVPLDSASKSAGETESADKPTAEQPQRKTLEVTCSGSLAVKGSERFLEYDFDVARVFIDDQLIEALPPNVKKFVTNFGLRGTFRGLINGSYSFDEADPSRETFTYASERVHTSDASVNFGLRFKDMKASGSLSGHWKVDELHRFSGNINVAEAWFNRLRLTNGEILMVFGNEHPTVAEIRTTGKDPSRRYQPPQEFVKRLSTKSVAETFQMSVHSGDLYAGEVDGFLFVDTGEVGDLGGDFVGTGLQLSKASKDIFGVDGRNLTGTASGQVRFTGRARDFRSIRGEGYGVVKQARLAELPLFVGLLSILNLDFGGATGRSYFNELTVPYTIEDGFFKSAKIELQSPGIKLLGSGTMDFKGNLDLDFEPRLFNFTIPLVDDIFSLLKDGLARIHIGGGLSKPEIEFRTAASLLRIPIEPAPPPERRLPSDLRDKE